MTDTTEEARAARRARHEVILAEVAQEEAEAAEAEIAEQAGTLDMPLHLRIDRELDAQLRRRAAAEHIPMLVSGHNISTTEVESALVLHPSVAEAIKALREHVATQIGPLAKPR